MYELRDDQTSGPLASIEVPFLAEVNKGLEVVLLDIPRLTNAGTKFTIKFFISNTGNTPTALHLEVHQQEGISAQLPKEEISLQSQESKAFPIDILPFTC